jgi:ABC-2 type transport system ATP-binding protein
MTESPAIELRNATKRFGTVTALSNVSVAVAPGETVAMLGPNGAGKTTAVSLMLGMRRPSDGTARIFGGDPRVPLTRLRIGAMLQESGSPAMLTVRESVELFRTLYHRPISADAAIEAAQLGEKANARVATLSGGQRQRLYFALAIVGDPDVLFLDEPTAALDVESRRSFWEQITKLNERGKTILLTTHYLEEADALADRIIVINRGVIVAEGSPAEIKARASGKHVRFVADGMSREWLASLPGVQSVTLSGNQWTLYTMQPEAVLQAIFARNATISELEVQGVGLEEAVLSLTAAKAAEAA